MYDFFSEKCVKIHNRKGEEIELCMRPLKIKELPLLIRINRHADSNSIASDIELTMELLELIGQTIDSEIQDDWIAEELIDVFFKYNFPDIEKRKAEHGKGKEEDKDFGIVFDFLIWQGHNFSEILEYTLPQFLSFEKAALDRLLGYKKPKKMSPFDLASKIGIKLKQKNG